MLTQAVNEVIIVCTEELGHRQWVALTLNVSVSGPKALPGLPTLSQVIKLLRGHIQKRSEHEPKTSPSMRVPPSSAFGPMCPNLTVILSGGSCRSGLGMGH